MNKKVPFPPKPTATIPPNADDWVSSGASSDTAEGKPEVKAKNEDKPESKEPMSRFTFDVPASLHRRVKAGCANRGIKMADLIREFLEKEFPA